MRMTAFLIGCLLMAGCQSSRSPEDLREEAEKIFQETHKVAYKTKWVLQTYIPERRDIITLGFGLRDDWYDEEFDNYESAQEELKKAKKANPDLNRFMLYRKHYKTWDHKEVLDGSSVSLE